MTAATNLGHPLNLGIGWTARDVPGMRREMLQWLDSREGRDWLTYTCDRTGTVDRKPVWLIDPKAAVRIMLQQTATPELSEPMLIEPGVLSTLGPKAVEWYMRRHLTAMFGRQSTSFFVTGEMMALAVATAEALPENWKLEPEDLPSPSGLMVFGDHDPYLTESNPETVQIVGPVRYAAVTWTPELRDAAENPARPSVVMEWWARVADLPSKRSGQWDRWPKLVGDLESHVAFGEQVNPERRAIRHLRLIYTIWQLMQQQKHVGVAHEIPDRAEVKRNRRADIPDPAVRLIHLRRMSGPPSGNHRHVEWSKRWIVSAHWRQQKYPRTGDIRPKLIMPYVKGPEDKPLDSRPVVKVWSR